MQCSSCLGWDITLLQKVVLLSTDLMPVPKVSPWRGGVREPWGRNGTTVPLAALGMLEEMCPVKVAPLKGLPTLRQSKSLHPDFLSGHCFFGCRYSPLRRMCSQTHVIILLGFSSGMQISVSSQLFVFGTAKLKLKGWGRTKPHWCLLLRDLPKKGYSFDFGILDCIAEKNKGRQPQLSGFDA